MKIFYLERNRFTQLISAGEKLDGIYHYSDPEEEDSGWNNMSYYLFYRNGNFIWQISYFGTKYIYNFYDQSNPISSNLNLEQFLEACHKEAPETIDWILFNLEQVKGDSK